MAEGGRVGVGFVELKLRVGELEKNLKRAQAQFKTSTTKMQKQGINLGNTFKRVGAIIAASFVLREIKQFTSNAVREFASFSSGIAEVGTLSEEVRKDLKGFGDQLLEVSIKTAQPLDRLQKAMFDAVSAGIPAADAIEFLGTAGKLAVAGVTDVSTATDGLTSIINAYGFAAKDANKVADAFFTAQKFGKTTVAELSRAVGKLAPITSAAGVSMDEMFAALSRVTLAGISTDEATTSLVAVMNSFLAPQEQAIVAAKKLGIELSSQALRTKGLKGVLEEISKAEGDQIDIANALGITVRGLKGILSITGDEMKGFNKILEGMQSASGATETAFGDMSKTLTFQLDQLTAVFTKMFVEVGEELAPSMAKLIEIVKEGIPQFTLAAKVIGGPLLESFAFLAETISGAIGFWSEFLDLVDKSAAPFKGTGDRIGNLIAKIFNTKEAIKQAKEELEELHAEDEDDFVNVDAIKEAEQNIKGLNLQLKNQEEFLKRLAKTRKKETGPEKGKEEDSASIRKKSLSDVTKHAKKQTEEQLLDFSIAKSEQLNITKKFGEDMENFEESLTGLTFEQLQRRVRDETLSLEERAQANSAFQNKLQEENLSTTDALKLGLVDAANQFGNSQQQMLELGRDLANGLTNSLTNDFTSIIKGEMNDLGAVFGNIWNTIKNALISAVASMAAEWLIKHALMTAATVTAATIEKAEAAAVTAAWLLALAAKTAVLGPIGTIASSVGIGLAKGGIVPGGFRPMQEGGIVSQPTLGLIGEGSTSEAVVPLPDNKSIPVKFENGMGGGGPITINVVMDGKILGRAIFDLSQRRSLSIDPTALLERGVI